MSTLTNRQNNNQMKDKRKASETSISKKICLVLGILLIGASLVHCSTRINVTQHLTELNYGEKYSVYDLVETDDDNVSLSIEDYGDTYCPKELGTEKLTIIAEDDNSSTQDTFEFSVVDNRAPVIRCKKKISLDQFSGIDDLLSKVKATVTDNCDSNISIEDIDVSGEIDTLSKGSYKVVLSVSDESGNIAEKTVKVKVVNRSDGGIDARESHNHIGEYCELIGVVKSYSYRPDVNGQPTFINVADNYPATDGMQVVIWGENRTAEMIDLCDKINSDVVIGVQGTVKLYKGIPEIIVYSPDQIRILGKVQ